MRKGNCMRRSGDSPFLRSTAGAEMRNETGAAADFAADTHQIIDRRGDIKNRDRLGVYPMFAGTLPEHSFRMMPCTFDGIYRIK